MKRSVFIIAAALLVLSAGFAGQQHAVYADSAFTVTTAKDAPDAAIGDGICLTAANKCSLRAAIQEANADPDNTVITLAAATYKLKIAGVGEAAAATGDLDISTPVVIQGVSQAATIIDAKLIDRAFDLQTSSSLSLFDLTVKNGLVEGEQGGAIRVEQDNASFGASRITISDSRSGVAGGAISAVLNVSVGIDGSTFTGNQALQGGALYLYQTNPVILEANLFRANSAMLGGALTVYLSTLTLYYNQFEDNKAACPAGDLLCVPTDSYGGALYVDGSAVTLYNETVEGNTSAGYGGGVAVWQAGITMSSTTLANNKAGVTGGGLYLYDTIGTIVVSTIVNNKATNGSGGGITLDASAVDFENSTLSGNSASTDGGGLYVTSTAPRVAGVSQFNYVTIAFNTAGDGGGGVFRDANGLELNGVILSGNTAGAPSHDCGGDVEVNYSLIENPAGCTITGNAGNLSGQSANLEPLSYGIHGLILAHFPAVGSPVLDAVASCTIMEDQYANTRFFGFPCTMGSVEPGYRNLLKNADFEAGVTNWKVSSPDGKDKSSGKQPYTGKRSFVFVGAAGKASVLKQGVKTASVLNAIAQGDSLCASGMFYTANINGKSLTIQVMVKYSDGVKEKLSQPVDLFDDSYVSGCSGEVVVDYLGGTRSLKKAQARVTSTSTGGKVYVDSMSLTLYPAGTRRSDGGTRGGVLPLPAAPEGFRGGN